MLNRNTSGKKKIVEDILKFLFYLQPLPLPTLFLHISPHAVTEWMGMFCRKSCETCLDGTKATCEDSNERCADWAKDGACDANPDFMLKKCERTCGACGPLKPTVDPSGCYDRKKVNYNLSDKHNQCENEN